MLFDLLKFLLQKEASISPESSYLLHFCGVRRRCPQSAKPGAKNAELLKTCFLNWFLRKHLASLPRKQVDIFAPISYIDNPFLS